MCCKINRAEFAASINMAFGYLFILLRKMLNVIFLLETADQAKKFAVLD